MSSDIPAGRIAVVGNRETVVAFQAAGLSVHPVETGPAAAELIQELVAAGFRVIFFTEELFADLAPVLERYRHAAVPCLIALPQGDSQRSVARLKEVVKRAVGADVFAGPAKAARVDAKTPAGQEGAGK